MDTAVSPNAYTDMLAEYLLTHGEEPLYRVSLLSQSFIDSGVGPEDIVALHFESLEQVQAGQSHFERARTASGAEQFLLEVMIAYGVRYREYLEMKLAEGIREAEARAALEHERALDAERAQLEKADLLAVVAHELRTPLTAAMGNLDLASRSLQRGQLERVAPLLETAREAMGRLSRLSGDLVEASRGGLPSLRTQRHHLDEIVAQACAWARPAAAAKGVTLSDPSVGAPIAVLADADALLSVFGNLLSNAIRYTPGGGEVAVRLGTSREWSHVEVADTGMGMTAQTVARIFEKFYRAPEARSVEAQGLGLGLALVQQLVQAHGGRVEVESVLAQGSTFRVLLPVLTTGGEEQHGD